MIRLYANKKYKVQWLDISSFPEWTHRDEILKLPETIIESVYIYVGKGKGGLCFAGEYNGNDYGNISILPRGCIKHIKNIR
jgi:hypothetical protein